MSAAKYYDGIAIGAAALCLGHCLFIPALIVFLPALTVSLTLSEDFHVWALMAGLPVSALALLSGYRRHRSLAPSLTVLPGLCLLASGVLLAASETEVRMVTVAGAIAMTLGHGLNWRAMRDAGPVSGPAA